MTEDAQPTERRIDRRTLLRAGLTTGAAALAGCLGDDETSEETPTPTQTATATATPTATATETPEPTETATETPESTPTGDESIDTELPLTGERVPELAAFDEVMVTFMEERNIPAGALGIAKDGEVVFERGYGWGTPDRTEPVEPDTMFRIGSISKQITDAAVFQLFEAEKLAPEDAVLPMLDVEPPDDGPADDRWEDVVVEHLLTHRGGWDIDQLGYDPIYAQVRIAKELGLDEPPTKYDITRYMLDQPMQFDPGERREYSNFGYSLLGQVIESVTGMDYEEYVAQELFEPAAVDGIEIGRTKPADRNPREIWYQGDETYCADVFDLDVSGGHTCADTGFLIQEQDAAGGYIASTTSMLDYLDSYSLGGRPRDQDEIETPFPAFGSHPDSFALAGHYDDRVDVVALFNGREVPATANFEIDDMVVSVLDSVDDWP